MKSVPKEVLERLVLLKKAIEKHRYNYHVLDTQDISDEEFAEMLAEAQAAGYAEADPSFDVDGIEIKSDNERYSPELVVADADRFKDGDRRRRELGEGEGRGRRAPGLLEPAVQRRGRPTRRL